MTAAGQGPGVAGAAAGQRALTDCLPCPLQPAAMPAGREVILEFHQVGAYIKVSAVDPVTLTEVSISFSPSPSLSKGPPARSDRLRKAMKGTPLA